MVARLDLAWGVSQKTLPDRLYANAVQNGEMLLFIPLSEPQQSLRYQDWPIRFEMRSLSSFPKHPANYGMSSRKDKQQ